MKRIELSTLGKTVLAERTGSWEAMVPAGPARILLDTLVPGSWPNEVQTKAISDAKLLTSRRNLLVSSTTNSGKTILGYLALLRGVGAGRRALLLEPLRALAQEKHAELSRLAANEAFVREGGFASVEIATGDYRLDRDRMQAPPPEGGEIVVATPERIEAILRNPEHDDWVRSLSTVVVDEAHLLADPLRGPSLEYVVTSLKRLSAPPRLVLLSATLGDEAPLLSWLPPCDLVSCPDRSPALHRSLLVMEPEDELLETLTSIVGEVLSEPGNAVLVFVYQTAAADKLSRELAARLGELGGPVGSRSYHSRQSAATRERTREEFASGACRCVVSTTALAMGVNLPATHVIVRDLARGLDGPLRPEEIVQMTGRAGRGDREGHALLVLKPKDPWSQRDLVAALETDRLAPIRSTLVPDAVGTFTWERRPDQPPLAKTVLSLLGRVAEGGMAEEELAGFLRATLAGEEAVAGLKDALLWLSSPSRVLVAREAGQWIATRLGRSAIRSSAPLAAAAGAAQLVRDLLSIDANDEILRGFSRLDLLVLAEMLSSGVAPRIRFSEKLALQVDDWMAQTPEKSVLFVRWIRGAEGFSKADEILGSLGTAPARTRGSAAAEARKLAYLATCRAVILWQRGLGARPEDLARRWGLQDLEEVEEKWRDDRLFLLGSLAPLWELRCFYYHLREECGAGDERIWRVKRILQRLAAQSYQLLDLVAWASPLGPVFVRMRRTLSGAKGATPARATLRRLEEHGIASVEVLRNLTEADYKRMGIRSDLARVIRSFLRRG